ncbi:hypothetical protein KP509_26G041100 [Ceratopteris richardii]|nr:hypothetical protein KP509_26G041100 [Ceratopteris richardii]
MPELKKLKLRKNSWDSETYQFDEIFSETTCQKRVYEVIAKPVVESVLDGCNGAILAYGQTGTGKTFTLGKLGKEDVSDRGIMVRALEDILADTSCGQDTVTVSYLQVYMESVWDLLAPEKDNITITEDPKTGDISLPGATSVEIRDQKSIIQVLRTGKSNFFSGNKKLGIDNSGSHVLLLVNVKKTFRGKPDRLELAVLNENGSNLVHIPKGQTLPTIRSSKLLIADLAGSEIYERAGFEGPLTVDEAKFIKHSLTCLGKCITALAEDSTHVPFKESKLTKLLGDSFTATAKTSLIITIGPSPQYRGETTSTILFGQKAMKAENINMKLKDEFDYKNHCKKLETELDKLIAENERQAKVIAETEEEIQTKVEKVELMRMEIDKKLKASLQEIAEEIERIKKEHNETVHRLEKERSCLEKDIEKSIQSLSTAKTVAMAEKELQMQSERLKSQKELKECVKEYEHRISEMTRNFESEQLQKELLLRKLQDMENEMKKRDRLQLEKREKLQKLAKKVERETQLREESEKELASWKSQANGDFKAEVSHLKKEAESLRHELEEHRNQSEKLKEEAKNLKQRMLHISYDHDETRKFLDREPPKAWGGSESPMSLNNSTHMRETINGQRATIAKLFEQVGVNRILSLMESEDIDVRVHAVKVIANLAAEEANQERIVEAGGVSSLLRLLENSEEETCRRVAAGAIANLAMKEKNQELIHAHGGINLLARTANEAEDPQTLRMVAGAIANLCGNEKLLERLNEESGLKALLIMSQSRHVDVLAQVARGFANLAKCESRASAQGQRKGRSLLIESGALPWVVSNANVDAANIRRHIELALCHLAQHEANAKDLLESGALWELVRISRDCSREDIKNLARRTLTSSSAFQAELKRMQMVLF